MNYPVGAPLPAHAKTADVKVAIRADDGKVTLEGISISAEERHAAVEVVSHVAGVNGVDNKLKVMKDVKLFPSSKT